MNLNRELPQSSVASGHKHGEMQFYHTGTFDHFFFHYTRAHLLYEAPVAKIFVQLARSASHGVGQLNKIMKKVCFFWRFLQFLTLVQIWLNIISASILHNQISRTILLLLKYMPFLNEYLSPNSVNK